MMRVTCFPATIGPHKAIVSSVQNLGYAFLFGLSSSWLHPLKAWASLFRPRACFWCDLLDSPLSCLLVHSGVAWVPFGQALTGEHAPVADRQSAEEPATCLVCTWVKGILWGCSAASTGSTALFQSVLLPCVHSLRELHLGNQQEKVPPCLPLHACFPHLLSPEMNVKWKGLLRFTYE